MNENKMKNEYVSSSPKSASEKSFVAKGKQEVIPKNIPKNNVKQENLSQNLIPGVVKSSKNATRIKKKMATQKTPHVKKLSFDTCDKSENSSGNGGLADTPRTQSGKRGNCSRPLNATLKISDDSPIKNRTSSVSTKSVQKKLEHCSHDKLSTELDSPKTPRIMSQRSSKQQSDNKTASSLIAPSNMTQMESPEPPRQNIISSVLTRSARKKLAESEHFDDADDDSEEDGVLLLEVFSEEDSDQEDKLSEDEVFENCLQLDPNEVSYHQVNEAGELLPTEPFPISGDQEFKILKNILVDAGLENEIYIDEFKSKQISDKNVHELQLADIEIVFSGYDSFVKKGFYNSLVLWKRENPIKPIEAPSNQFHKYNEKKHLINIESIMRGDIAGQQAIKFYQDNKMLDDEHRGLVITVLITFIIQSRIWIKKNQFEDLTNKILHFFKCDNPEKERPFYFIDGRGGPLFNRYNNKLASTRITLDFPFKNNRVKFSKKNTRKIASRASTTDIPQSSSESTADIEPTSQQLEIIAKVNTYYKPWEVFKYDWMRVFDIRSRDYKSLEYNDLINKWPVLTDVEMGYHLISADFEALFPTYKHDFMQKWIKLQAVVIEHGTTKKHFVVQPGDCDVQLKTFKALHYILPTVVHSAEFSKDNIAGSTTPSWKKKTKTTARTKFSIMDSIKSMVLEVEHNEKVREMVDKYAQEKQAKNMHFHPLLVVKKDNNQKPIKYLLYYNRTILVIPCFALSVMVLLQICFVMNFQYATESYHVYSFLAKYFFEVEIKEKVPGQVSIARLFSLLSK